MRTPNILRKMDTDPQKAVAPDKGAAAFSCSTGNTGLPNGTCFPGISQHSAFCAESNGNKNIMPKKHYFRSDLAETPPALVVRIEGQIRPSNSSGRQRYE